MKITWCLLLLDLVYSVVPLIFPPQWKQLIQHHQELLFDLELACAHAQLIAFAALASVSWMCAVFIITSKSPSKLLRWRVSEKPHTSSSYVRWSWPWRARKGRVAFCGVSEKKMMCVGSVRGIYEHLVILLQYQRPEQYAGGQRHRGQTHERIRHSAEARFRR